MNYRGIFCYCCHILTKYISCNQVVFVIKTFLYFAEHIYLNGTNIRALEKLKNIITL